MQVVGLELYREVVLRYFRMGAGQFLRNFRKDYQLQKTLAHRKSILQKKEKANKKKLKVPIPQIEHDASKDKTIPYKITCFGGSVEHRGIANIILQERATETM